jgi:hypothetical protein
MRNEKKKMKKIKDKISGGKENGKRKDYSTKNKNNKNELKISPSLGIWIGEC